MEVLDGREESGSVVSGPGLQLVLHSPGQVLESRLMIACIKNVSTYFIQSPVPLSRFPCIVEVGGVVVVVVDEQWRLTT